MSSSTLVPVYQYIGRLYASVFISQSTIRIIYILFDKLLYNCDVVFESLCSLHF